MKGKILEALKAKFEGVDAKILGRIADKLAKTTTSEEDVATAVEGVSFSDVLNMYGDSRATEAANTAISNYEKKHGIKNGKKVMDEDEDSKDGLDKQDDAPEWAKALIASNKAMQDEINALKKGKVTEGRKQRFDKILEGLTEAQKKAYSRTSYDSLSDEEFDTLLSEVGEEVEGLVSENKASGASFRPPMTNGKSKDVKAASDKEVDDVLGKLGF